MDPHSPSPLLRHFPEAKIDRYTLPLAKFLRIEAASGILLALCTVAALVIANTQWFPEWKAFWDAKLTIDTGPIRLSDPRWYWVNDALMAIFFFVVGLEIKRELVDGHLSDRSKILLPVVAAIGGALVPAGIFYFAQRGTDGLAGWAIPMATDIAFVVGALALLGKRVPPSLKVLLLSLAIVDDLLAVVIIAFFFAESIAMGWLAGAGVGIALVLVLQRLGVRRVGVYALFGAFIWLCTLKSGLHPTIAGVVLGLLTPARAWLGPEAMKRLIVAAEEDLDHAITTGHPPTDTLDQLSFGAREAVSPLERLEHSLHPWVGFVIMPIFALANSGVPIDTASMGSPLALAIGAALFLGKPLGICLTAWLAIRAGRATLPEGVSWPAMIGAGILCGTGFTMSLFITSLSFEGALGDTGRVGVLLGSGLSLLVGFIWLRLTLRKPELAS
ncbi:MAG: Na+/H+ antiporter NhaA [Planctomycetota bacterium]